MRPSATAYVEEKLSHHIRRDVSENAEAETLAHFSCRCEMSELVMRLFPSPPFGRRGFGVTLPFLWEGRRDSEMSDSSYDFSASTFSETSPLTRCDSFSSTRAMAVVAQFSCCCAMSDSSCDFSDSTFRAVWLSASRYIFCSRDAVIARCRTRRATCLSPPFGRRDFDVYATFSEERMP